MVAELLGYVASICFTLQYAPQALLNYERQSVVGFSGPGVIIKLIGAAFLAVNSYLRDEPTSVFLYGCFNVTQHLIFMIQFGIYPSHEGKAPDRRYLLMLFFPLLPIYLGVTYPPTIEFTSYFKPIAQVLSHLPQLYECFRLKTTKGIYMAYSLDVPFSTSLMYINSLFQAFTIYVVALYYGEFYISAPTWRRMSSKKTIDVKSYLDEV